MVLRSETLGTVPTTCALLDSFTRRQKNTPKAYNFASHFSNRVVFFPRFVKMPWIVFVLFVVFLCLMPLCWLSCNRLCRCFPAKYALTAKRTRIFLRAWFASLFVCIWLSAKPRQHVVPVDGEDFSAWEWQLPLYAAIPVVFTLSDSERRISLCVILLNLAVVAVASLVAFIIVSVTWACKASKDAQIVVFSLLQPTASSVAILLQNVVAVQRRAFVLHFHILELLVVFQSFVYGATSSDTFTAWEQPIFAFVSYTFGLAFTFMCVLFIAPMWVCVCWDDDDDKKTSPSSPTKTEDIEMEVAMEDEDRSNDEEEGSSASPTRADDRMGRHRITLHKPKVDPFVAGKKVIDLNSIVATAAPTASGTAISAPRVKSLPLKNERRHTTRPASSRKLTRSPLRR